MSYKYDSLITLLNRIDGGGHGRKQEESGMTETEKFEAEIQKVFTMLPGILEAFECEEKFITEWRKIFGSFEAKSVAGIVYCWMTDKPIPRLRHESRILYIGKSINSISTRHYPYAAVEASGENDWNKKRYIHILKEFGAISFHVLKVPLADNHRQAIKKKEAELLNRYFDIHLETPPMNRMSY